MKVLAGVLVGSMVAGPALARPVPDRLVVLTIHGAPDAPPPWVLTPPALPAEYLACLKAHHYRAVALRELARYLPPNPAPAATRR